MSRDYSKDLQSSMVEGITGFNLCSYLIALEGWRRGLTLKFHNKLDESVEFAPRTKYLNSFGRLSSLSDGEKTHYFSQSRGDSTTKKAYNIASKKQLTKKYLKKNNVPILDGTFFTKNDNNNDIIGTANEIGYPVIIKPTNGSLSLGVVINIQNDKELEDALVHVREKLGYKSIILEKYFHGDDIRTYVVDGNVVAAIKRIPAQVTGDGISTIRELIHKQNKARMDNPYLNARCIKINTETTNILSTQGYKIDDILEMDKTIRVKNKSTLTQGVNLYDITDELSEEIKEIAVNTIKSIPGLTHASIDMLTDGKEAYVLEINTDANISLHMFPTEGKSQNVAAHLIDYYFPETISCRNNNRHMSFDYLSVFDALSNNFSDYIEVRSLENYNMPVNEIVIYGKEFNEKFIKFIIKKATSRRINGTVKLINRNKLYLLCATYDNNPINWLCDQIKQYNKDEVSINFVEIKECVEYVNIGFK